MEGFENKFKLNNCVYFIKHNEKGYIIQQGYISKIKLDEDHDYVIYEIREDRFGCYSERTEDEIFSSLEEARTYLLNSILRWTIYRSYDY